MALVTKIAASISTKLTTSPDLSAQRTDSLLDIILNLANGTGAGQADRAYVDSFSIAASGNSDIDLVSSIVGPDGVTPASMARVKALMIVADATNTNNIVVGAAASNPWVGFLGATHTLTLRPGAGELMWAGSADATGYVTVATTGDLLRLANSGAGTAVTGKIIVIGASV